MILLGTKPKIERPRTLVSWSPGGYFNASPVEEFRRSMRRPRLRRLFTPGWRRPIDPKAWTVRGSNARVTQQAAGTIFDTYTTAKSVINTQALLNIPAGDDFWYVGKMLRITVMGGMTTLVTTPGTVTMSVNLGPPPETAAAAVFTTGAMQINATAHTLLPWWLDILLTVQALGSGTAAKLMGMGRLQGIMFTLTAAQTDAVNTGGIFSAPATAPAQGTGFDSTVGNILDFWTGWSISSASNRVQVQQYVVEELN